MATRTNRKTSSRSKTKRARKTVATTGNGAGKLEEPKSPMPPQHQRKPGIESKMKPRPHYLAPHYKGANKLKDKVALITGGDSGIGRGVAVLFAREAAAVALVNLRAEASDAKETKSAVEAEGRRALTISGDVRDSKFCERA